MAILPASIDYTDRDFDALRTRLIALLRSTFPGWTDFATASFGTLLLEMYAFVGDVIGYYVDAQARESRLVTATQRRNVIALARMLGYRLHGAQAATCDIEFVLEHTPKADVVIPAGTVIRTQEVTEPTRFQLLQAVTIEEGANPATAIGTVEHSETHHRLIDAHGLERRDVFLDRAPYLDSTAIVSAANGEYVEQRSLLNSGPNDRHFMALVDERDRATLRFGDGISGAPPTGTLSVTYRTGGGVAGNVEATTLVIVEGSFTDVHGRPVQLSVRNPEPASGGIDRQSIASAKQLAPESLRTLTRSVTREDFEVNAKRVPGVARALMLTSEEDSTIEENSGVLYIIPQGGGPPSSALKEQVLHQVTVVYPHLLTFQVSVQDPVYKPIDIEARVYLRQGVDKSRTQDRIRINLRQMFAISNDDGTPNTNINFGFYVRDSDGFLVAEVTWSDVFNVIRDTAGVRKVGAHSDLSLNGLPQDIKLRQAEFPVLGDVTLIDGDTGGFLS